MVGCEVHLSSSGSSSSGCSSSSSSSSECSSSSSNNTVELALALCEVRTRGETVGLVNLHVFALCLMFSVFGVVAWATTLTSVCLKHLVSASRMGQLLPLVCQKTHEGAVSQFVVG